MSMTNIRIGDYTRTLALSFTFTIWATLTYRPESFAENKPLKDWLGQHASSGKQSQSSNQESTSNDEKHSAPKNRYISVEKAKKDITDYRAHLMYLQPDMTIKFFSVVEGHENHNTHIHLLAYNWNGTIETLRQSWRHGYSLIERIEPEDNKERIAYMMKDCTKYDTDNHTFKYLGRKWTDSVDDYS